MCKNVAPVHFNLIRANEGEIETSEIVTLSNKRKMLFGIMEPNRSDSLSLVTLIHNNNNNNNNNKNK
jgi:hypothetical protein